MRKLVFLLFVFGACVPAFAQTPPRPGMSERASAAAATPEERLAAAGLSLPAVQPPVATFANSVRSGNLLLVAGHAHCESDVVKGKLGREFTVEQGQAYARRVGLCLLASIKADVGKLSRVKRFVRIMGMVNTTPEFTEHPKVMNGFSDLMVLAFLVRRNANRFNAMDLDGASLPIK